MKIGLLAYHSVCNFGAFLQLLSTVEYVRNHGDEPVVLNWVPIDMELDYEKRSTYEVRALYQEMRNKYYPMTALCRTDEALASVIKQEHIEAVIIGSDAVCQHHSFRERFHFPTKKIFYISHPTSDRMFPNPYWATFNHYLNNPVPVAVISVSSQDSQYQYIKGYVKKKMAEAVFSYKYLSVRDDWSQKMMCYLTEGKINPMITPDPVFAFNQNAKYLLPSKQDIIDKYKIPEKYVLLSFKDAKNVSQSWIDAFEELAESNNLACLKLQYADADAFGDIQYSIGKAVSPLDWYSIIKYSSGYVGNNMHPIVVSLHNAIPFFSFDNYGISKYRGLVTNEKTSKIYHLLDTAGFLDCRVFSNSAKYRPPKPERVMQALKTFDCEKARRFADKYYEKYQTMMDEAYTAIGAKCVNKK